MITETSIGDAVTVGVRPDAQIVIHFGEHTRATMTLASAKFLRDELTEACVRSEAIIRAVTDAPSKGVPGE